MDQHQTDVIIVGSGVTGHAAAVTLAAGGASVTIFEKQAEIGGTSVNFLGIFAAESDMQKQRFITYSRDQAFTNIMEYSHWLANPRLVRAVVEESAKTIRWLKDEIGVVFMDVVTNIPDAPQTYHLIQNSGADVVKALNERAVQLGVTIKTSSPVVEIKRSDETYLVTVGEKGAEKEYKSRAVIIASGGYANNEEWIRKYSGLELNKNLFVVGNEGKMGDGIRMAHELGAAEEGLGVLELLRTGRNTPETMNQVAFTVVQPYLWVNSRGERFCNECVTFDDTSMGNAHVKQKNGLSYSLFDMTTIRRLMEKGIDKAMTVDFPPGTPLDILDKEIDEEAETRPEDVFKADSIKELAELINVDPETLQHTVDEYNSFAEKGHDPLFSKNPKYLFPLIESPYYAVRAQTVFLGTMGGIKINYRTEVLDKDDNTIPGLYAGGFDAGGMYGDSYGIRYSTGLASGFAVNSGRLAGKNALNYLSTSPAFR